MVPEDCKDKSTAPSAAEIPPPIPPERLMTIQCSKCQWNAWIAIQTPVRELSYDAKDTSGQVRGMPFQLIVCSGCGTRLILTRNEDGTLHPIFDEPRNPLYRDALSGRVAVSK
jgi:hypothetical protein